MATAHTHTHTHTRTYTQTLKTVMDPCSVEMAATLVRIYSVNCMGGCVLCPPPPPAEKNQTAAACLLPRRSLMERGVTVHEKKKNSRHNTCSNNRSYWAGVGVEVGVGGMSHHAPPLRLTKNKKRQSLSL